eukprot:1903170-Pleurochrysis_carterae.AAC.1
MAPPVRHLPFVPCRLQPRDVILQARQRVVQEADGTTREEDCQKPRVNTNSSFGGPDGVNAAVPETERVVALPRVQALARALAIVDTVGREEGAGDEERAAAYVVDAESAYRFCPVQIADVWLLCFVWFNDEGNAGVVIHWCRGFGWAYAPNRFERVFTMVAASVQAAQGRFDEQYPPPAAARRWGKRRAALQTAGALAGGAEQLTPRYLQVYIDDLRGWRCATRYRCPSSSTGMS